MKSKCAEAYKKVLCYASKEALQWSNHKNENAHREHNQQLIEDYLFNFDENIKKRLENEFFNFGPLQDLIFDEEINEILIHGMNAISFEKKGQLNTLDDGFLDLTSYQRIFELLTESFFKSINFENPTGNGYWKGFRVHVIGPPLTKQFEVSLRRIGGQKINRLQQLLDLETISASTLSILKDHLKWKSNILISGSTSSGKTTFIQCLMNEVCDERFVILEDSEELMAPNKISSNLLCPTRQEQYSIKFEMKDLVKESLRMRPDRIVLGEARSDEAKDFIQALSTGHRGSFASIHASSPREALTRLECLILQGAQNWPAETVKQVIYGAIDIIIQIKKLKSGQRKITSISKISSLDHNTFLIDELLQVS